jgi:hypothetical protein
MSLGELKRQGQAMKAIVLSIDFVGSLKVLSWVDCV